MGYYINLQAIDIGEYRDCLKSADLLPSRVVLKNDIDTIFEKIRNSGITNLEELFENLKNKKRVLHFSELCDVDEKYLTILARELKSYRQPPSKLKDFPGIPPEVISGLKKAEISNTLQLYEKVLTKENRNDLDSKLKIGTEWILKLTSLADLCRIRWVSHTFAFILLETGYFSAQSVAEADFVDLHKKVNDFIEEKGLFKVRIGLHDIKLCVEAAKDLSFDINF